uniref:SWIM-type domain-containing protein n=1 Tax=Echinococcus canadensis TaxID=519352 RepID=A0A915EVB4_9CEST
MDQRHLHLQYCLALRTAFMGTATTTYLRVVSQLSIGLSIRSCRCFKHRVNDDGHFTREECEAFGEGIPTLFLDKCDVGVEGSTGQLVHEEEEEEEGEEDAQLQRSSAHHLWNNQPVSILNDKVRFTTVEPLSSSKFYRWTSLPSKSFTDMTNATSHCSFLSLSISISYSYFCTCSSADPFDVGAPCYHVTVTLPPILRQSVPSNCCIASLQRPSTDVEKSSDFQPIVVAIMAVVLHIGFENTD